MGWEVQFNVPTDCKIDYLEYLKETWIVFSIENIVSKMVDKVSITKEEEKLITIDDQEIQVVPSWKFLLFT